MGWLYGANTLGALVGALLCGLWLLPSIGLVHSVQVGAALSFVSGTTVLAVLRAVRKHAMRPGPLGLPEAPGPSEPPEPPGPEEPPKPPGPTLSQPLSRDPERGAAPRVRPPSLMGAEAALFSLLVFATGYVAIGAQVLWIRFLALLIPNGVHAYTLTLAAVLLGIVGGSLLSARLADRARSPALHFGALQVGWLRVYACSKHWYRYEQPTSVRNRSTGTALCRHRREPG